MCTCCITWWLHHPVFSWIEQDRHSRAVVGYVTSWAHSCLSVSWEQSWGTELHHSWGSHRPRCRRPGNATPVPHFSPPAPPLSLFFVLLTPFLSPPYPLTSSLSERKDVWVTLHPGVQVSFCLSAWADRTQVQLLCCSRLCWWANDLLVFFSNTSPPTQQLLLQFT